MNFFKTWASGGSGPTFGGQLPTLFNANGYPSGTLTANLSGQCFLPPSYSGSWVFKWTGTLSATLGSAFTVSVGGGFVSGGVISGTNGRVVLTFNSPPNVISPTFGSGTTQSSLTSIVLCRSADESAVDAGSIYNPDFINLIKQENPNSIRPMGLCLNEGDEAMTNTQYSYRITENSMSWASPQFPPTAWAGNTSGQDTLTCGSYIDMPGSWTDKETFQTNTPANTVTISLANPAIVTGTSFTPGQIICFYTTGALPSPLTASTPLTDQFSQNPFHYGAACYFALDSGSTTRIATTPGGAAISTNGSTQSGTHSISPITGLAITAVANNGSGKVRLTMPSTATLSTNQIVGVNSGWMGVYKITVIDSTHVDLATTYPFGASSDFVGHTEWTASPGFTPVRNSGGTSFAYLSTATINVGSRGAKLIIGNGGVTVPTGGIATTGGGADSGVSTWIYDAALDAVVMAPGGLYCPPPVSSLAKLANACNKNIWYPTGVLSSSSFVQSQITEAATYLNSNLTLYVQWSNETWNSQFTQYYYTWQLGQALGFAYGVAGATQLNYTATGLRTLQCMQAATTAWSNAGRVTAKLQRVISAQLVGSTSNFQTYLLNGNDLSAPNNSSPNRPIDNADVLTYANYWQGTLINNQYQGTSGQYASMTTAADNYASGVPASITSALNWIDGDFRGTNGDGTPTGTINLSMAAITSYYAGWETVAASYDAGRVTPIKIVCYEGGYDIAPPTTAQCTTIGISTAYAAKVATLCTAYLNDTRSSSMIQSAVSAFRNTGTYPHNLYPAFLQLEGSGVSTPNEWSLLSGDLYSTPYQTFYGAVAANA